MSLVGYKSGGWRDAEGNRSFCEPLALRSLSRGAPAGIMGPLFRLSEQFCVSGLLRVNAFFSLLPPLVPSFNVC